MTEIQGRPGFDWRGILKNFLLSPEPGPELTGVEPDGAALPVLRARSHTGTEPLLVTVPDLAAAEALAAELQALLTELSLPWRLVLLPETVRGKLLIPGGEAARARALNQLSGGQADLIVASVHAALAPVPEPDSPAARERVLRVGDTVPFAELLAELVELDYDDEFEVAIPGEFARRGGLIDLYSPAEEYPCRLEFFGDQLESLRRFDPKTQRSQGEITSYRVIAPHPSTTARGDFDLFELWRDRAFQWFALQPDLAADSLGEYGEPDRLSRFQELLATFQQQGRLRCGFDSAAAAEYPRLPVVDVQPALAALTEPLPPELRRSSLELLRTLLLGQLRQQLSAGFRVALLAPDELTLAHLHDYLTANRVASPLLISDRAALGTGFLLEREKLVVLTERELLTLAGSRPGKQREQAPAAPPERDTGGGEEIFSDLDTGDYAVHLAHGIGIFRGLREIEHRGSRREVMVLEYRDDALLYVPLTQAHLVSRYFGHPGKVKLNALGSNRWNRDKESARQAVRDYAADLLRLQAVRQTVPGVSTGPETLADRLFEAEFPFSDTPDQQRATQEIKRDQESTRPMDRLLCGDVGYGKTELAMRAAFKAVTAGFQVVVLAPTTVLVQQHDHSFRERFAAYPYTIENLSRFRTPAEQRAILEKLRSGGIDILIGTHRLCSLKPSDFRNLGLIIIDEEQRFGVRHKEQLRRFRTEVDVLTMSATPIPRTLYLAMAGTRDLSTLMTAPRERLPVKTVIAPEDDALIVSAIRSELARGGQVYYLHNRVRSIEARTEKLRVLLPGVRFGIAHGQMAEGELESVMSAFLEHRLDVLVCSTIIESGLDIPNANTILIERADRFGLAELYQLRGRVGRWKHQAYAYLLLPRDQIITGDARKRIAAIRRCSQLGSSFQLAMRDLEIRGAGNLLGAEQSGHLNAIGFELYCRLLRQEAAKLRGRALDFLPEVELGIDFVTFAYRAPAGFVAAALPPDYIVGERLRVAAYRKLSALTSEAELEDYAAELTDRFGRPPEPAANLLTVTRLRILAARAGYTRLSLIAGKVLLQNNLQTYREHGAVPHIDYRNPPALRLLLLTELLRRAGRNGTVTNIRSDHGPA